MQPPLVKKKNGYDVRRILTILDQMKIILKETTLLFPFTAV